MKRFLSASVLFIFCSASLHAASCNPKAVTAGTNIWQIADSIQAMLCGDDYHVIGQADIPITITQQGLYCLCETITSAANDDTVITVSVSNVTINLNRRGIIKQRPTSGTDRAHIQVIGSYNVKICNGFLRTTTSSSSNGTLTCILTHTCHGVVIEDIQFVGNDENEVSTIAVKLDNTSEAAVIDCSAIEFGSGFIAHNSTASKFSDCAAMGIRFNGFAITGTSDSIIFVDCTSYTCTGAAFQIGDNSAVTNVLLCDCVAASCLLDTTTLATNSGFVITNTLTTQNIIFDHCVAQNMRNHGFRQSGGTNIMFTECFGCNNSVDGFNVTGISSQNVNLRTCMAFRNGRNGINAVSGPVNTQNAVNCIAYVNTNTQIVGFATPVTTAALAATGTGNYWYNYVP